MASPHQAPYLSLFQRYHRVFHKDFSPSLPTWSLWTGSNLPVYQGGAIPLHRMIHGMLGTERTIANSCKNLVYALLLLLFNIKDTSMC